MGASALAQRASAVQSLAAEGALLAGDSASGRTLAVYRHEHAAELSSSAASAASTLATERAAPALEPERRRLGEIARRVASGLRRLEDASRSESRILEHELQRAAAASTRLGDAAA